LDCNAIAAVAALLLLVVAVTNVVLPVTWNAAYRESRCTVLLSPIGARWGGWSKPRSGRFASGKSPGTHLM
jgi:hypothetical protein